MEAQNGVCGVLIIRVECIKSVARLTAHVRQFLSLSASEALTYDPTGSLHFYNKERDIAQR